MKSEMIEKITELIDRGQWKHSWHLKKNQYGYPDWCDKTNLQDCLRLAKEAKEEAINLLDLAGTVSVALEAELAIINEEELEGAKK